MTPKITLTDQPDEKSLEALGTLLHDFNAIGAGGPSRSRPLAIFLTNPGNGEVVGGLWGKTSFSYLHVELLYLPKSLRGAGLGSRLLKQAEEEAIQRGCHAAWLDTFSFQAPGFYQKLGYTVFATLEEYPPSHSRYFLSKSLVSEAK